MVVLHASGEGTDGPKLSALLEETSSSQQELAVTEICGRCVTCSFVTKPLLNTWFVPGPGRAPVIE